MPLMPERKLLHKVDPEYPPAALQHRIQGTVRFNAIIGKDGHIERLRLIDGHPLLVRSARQAVQQWIYRPALLGDKPVRVITQIDVPFQLDHFGKRFSGT
jgi:protein TonB